MRAAFTSKKIIPAVITLFLFCGFPFFYYSGLRDPDLLPRLVGICVFNAFLLLLIFFQDSDLDITIRSKRSVVLFSAFVLFEGLRWFSAINKEDSFFYLLVQINWAIFYLLCIILLIMYPDWLKMICRGIILSTVILLSASIFQFNQNWNEGLQLQNVSSLLSNKNFFSETLFASLPFLITASFYQGRTFRMASVIVSLLSVSVIIVLQSVNVIFATTIFLLLLGVFFLPRLLHQKLLLRSAAIKKISLLTCCIVIIAILFSGVLFKSSLGKFFTEVTAPVNISEVTGSNDNSIYERKLLWRNSWHLFAEQPIAGCGFGNWKILHAKYGIGGSHYISTGYANYEHPHNEYLFILSESGIAGFILFSAFLISVFASRLKKIRSSNSQSPSVIMFCGAIGFLLMSCFSYPMQRPFSMMLFLLMCAVLTSDHYPNSLEPHLEKKQNRSSRFLIFPLLMIEMLSAYIYFQRAKSEYFLKQAIACKQYFDWDNMIYLSEKALSPFYTLDNFDTPVSWYAGIAFQYDNKPDSALAYFKKAEVENPYHILVLNDLGAACLNANELVQAEKCFQRVLSISPQNFNARLNLATVQYRNGKISEATQTFLQMRDSVEYKSAEYQFEAFVLISAYLSKTENESGIASDSDFITTLISAHLTDTASLQKWISGM